MAATRLPPERYFDSIDADTERLVAMGERGLDASVPCCPGWTVDDVVRHTAQVFAHKVRVMADNAFPDPWPPADHATREPVEFLRLAKDELFTEFAAHEVSEPTTTFSPADSTIGFWIRRMALEVAVHRYDAELAHDAASGIADDVALDGIDELLTIMLGGPWWDDDAWQTEHPVEAVVAVQAGDRRWHADVRRRSVAITDGRAGTDGAGQAAATLGGEPQQVFLWLWGRVGDDAVVLTGDPRVTAEFRSRIQECTD